MTTVAEPRLEVDDDLEIWERAGLISRDQLRSIHDFERGHVQPTRTPMVVEVLTYLGVAAVLGAAITLVAQQWDQFGWVARVTLFVALAIGAGVGGLSLRGTANTPSSRAGSVLWVLSVAFTAAAGGVVVTEYPPNNDWKSMLIVAGPAWLLASRYWQLEMKPLQLVASVATFVPVLLAGSELVFGELTPTIAGMTLVLVGIAGIVPTLKGWVPPRRFAELLFAFVLLFGVWMVAVMPDALWAEVLGLIVSAAFLALSVRVRSIRFLGVGALGLFGFVTLIVMRHFAEWIGVPLALLVSGIGLIGAAILVARLRLLTTVDPDSETLERKGVSHA